MGGGTCSRLEGGWQATIPVRVPGMGIVGYVEPALKAAARRVAGTWVGDSGTRKARLEGGCQATIPFWVPGMGMVGHVEPALEAAAR